jgi:hypothetical protein
MAVNKTYSITLDLKKECVSRIPELVTGDNGNIFVLTLVDGTTAVSLTSAHVVCVFANKNGVYVQDSNDADGGVTISNNVVTVALKPSSYAEGTTLCEVQLYSETNDSNLVTSSRFCFDAKKSLLSDEVVTESAQYNTLQTLIALLDNMSVTISTLAAGASATASLSVANGAYVLALGVPQGADGATGDKGDKGDRGDKGDKGDTGEQGIQGLKGDKGDKGDPGAKGDKGDKGDRGDKGDKGDTGEQGIQGLKGDKGDKGDTGATGADGTDGADGSNGADGQSAYAAAQAGGYTDTQSNFYADLAAIQGLAAQLAAI